MRDRRGMTLMEVTLALLLFGMLATFILGVIDSVLGLWQSGERRGRGDLVFAAASERLRSDLGALHTGPDGWLVVDTWEALPEAEGRPAWRLPRLRFLADGGGLPADDPSGRAAVEIAWVFVPENVAGSRLTRLVRWARVDGGRGEGFEIDRYMADVQAQGDGLVLLDGVAYGGFVALDMDGVGDEDPTLDLPAGIPVGFPPRLRLEVERVAGSSRLRPPTLDDRLATAGGLQMTLRGTAPLRQPTHVLVDEEWIGISGTFPRLVAARRGERGTLPTGHERGAEVLLPETYSSEHALSGGGRRRR